MQKFFKRLVLICALISFFILLDILYYVFKPEPVVAEAYKVTSYKGPALTMDSTPANYDCIKLHRLDNKELTFCTRKKPLVLKEGSNIRGMYVSNIDTIYLDKDSPNSRILHELFHAVDIYNKKDNSEIRAYEMQFLYEQLLVKNIIK